MRIYLLLSLLVICFSAFAARAETRLTCTGTGIELQVLGSGGPIPDDARSSSGYLLWLDGRARLLVDAGGGTFQRFGAAGADIADLWHIAISHMHADHSADLAALVKGGYFSDRTAPLPVSGPDGRGVFPSLSDFLVRQFDAKRGSYAYLSGALDGSGGQFLLQPQDVDASLRKPVVVLDEGDFKVSAIGVSHGPVPALGYVVTVGERKLAFSGDQNSDNDAFWKLAANADLLVMHHAIPQGADRIARNLHAEPADIGRNAAKAQIATLVLSHHMRRSLDKLDESLRLIAGPFKGKLLVANDLDCFSL